MTAAAPEPKPGERWLSTTDIADRLGVSRQTAYVYISDGLLPAVDISTVKGGRPRLRVAESALNDFLATRAVTT